MSNLTDIANMRRLPGVMILDRFGTLLFMNEAVSGIVPIIHPKVPGGVGQVAPTIPEDIRSICLQLDAARGDGSPTSAGVFYCNLGNPYSLRAFPVGGVAEQSAAQHIMVLVEPIAERRQIDFEAVQKKHGLSRRELDVLKLVCQGMSNKEIAERLFISEHTAKDHLKSILKAFGAHSRSEVVGALSQ
jgi:DNA-binding CsgD family transcriptional regulator